MPINDIVADDFAHVYKQTNSWENAVSTDTGTGAQGSNTALAAYLQYAVAGLYVNYRTFGAFDLSSLSGTVTALSLRLTKSTTNSGGLPFYVLKGSDNKSASSGESPGIPYTADHYLSGVAGFDGDDYPYENTGLEDFGDGTGAEFSDETAQPTGTSVNSQFAVDLNSAAISHANSIIGTSNKFFVAIVNNADYDNTYGSATLTDGLSVQGTYVYPESDSTSAYRPVLRVTTSTATTVTTVTDLKLNGGNITLDGSVTVNKNN